MGSRWEARDKRKNGHLLINLSVCHFAPHIFYVGQPGKESGSPGQDFDRVQRSTRRKHFPHATKSNTKLTWTGLLWTQAAS
jgi:hypothetical protein